MKLTLNGVEIDATEEHAKLLLENGWAKTAEKPKAASQRKVAPRSRAAKKKE